MAKRKQGAPDTPSEDRVGYRNPPKEHRFQDGHKGNPWGCKGKPKPERDFLEERQRVRIEGRWRRLTRDQLIDHALYKAVVSEGNVSAAKELKLRRQERMARKAEAVDTDVLMPEDELALLRAVERRLRQRDPGADDDPEGSGEPEPEDDA